MKTRTKPMSEHGTFELFKIKSSMKLTKGFLVAMAAFAIVFGGCTGLTAPNDMATSAQPFGDNQGDSVGSDARQIAGTQLQDDNADGLSNGGRELASDRDAEDESDRFENDFDRADFEEEEQEDFDFEEEEPEGFDFEEEAEEDFDFEEEARDEFESEENNPEELEHQNGESELGEHGGNVPPPTGGGPVTTPQVCTQSGVPPAGCECATDPGFKTYTFEHAGEQRCMTSYVDPQATNEPLPLIIRPNCYTSNRLDHSDIFMAQQYGFHYLDLTSPDGGWAFPLNNRVNDSNYRGQCDDSATKDIGYLKGVFKVVDQMIADGLVDPDKVFVNGFSQNSVFAIFVGTCFPDRIAGVFQGGSGIYSQDDGSRPLPKCEGACTASAFIQHGGECHELEPCTDCQYFPVFPERTGAPIKACIAMYDDDGAAHSTAVPAYRLLKSQGHNPKLMIFGSDPEIFLGGHDEPMNPMAWIASCLGLHKTCSQTCSDTVLSCMDNFKRTYRGPDGTAFDMSDPDHRGFASGHYNVCLMENTNVCSRGCSATREMLTILETPACECDVNTVSCDCQTSNVPGACEPPSTR